MPLSPVKVVKLNDAEFREALMQLRKRGGVFQKAAEEAARMITHFDLDISEAHQVTNHGESRIKHCVKYDLPGACRLVTVQNEGVIYVLFVGDHAAVDRWLEKHEGLTLSCDPTTMRVKVVHVNRIVHEWKQPDSTVYTEANEPFFKRISQFDLSAFIPEPALQKQILRLNENSSDDEIQEVFDLVELKHRDRALVLFEMLFEVKRGDNEAALMRLKLYHRQAVNLSENPELEQEAIAANINSDQLVVLNELTVAERERLLNSEFQEWMIYLHPDQKRVAEADFDRPVVLSGISGSGKTCILIHRARYLARKYPGQRIGILTLNRSLARLLRNLVDQLCVGEESQQIEVQAFYDYFRGLLHELGSDRYLEQLSALAPADSPIQRVIQDVNRKSIANEVDTKSGETLEDTWSDFFQSHNPDVRSWMEDVCRYLEDYRIDASRYLREEFTLVRSAFSTPERNQLYVEFDRAGRSMQLLPKLRRDVLRLLLFYEEYMLAGGVLDVLGLTQAVLPLSREIRALPTDLRFRALLIDEFQDFSTLDLKILQLIPSQDENGLFLAGDTVQKIMVKRLKLSEVGLDRSNAKHIQIRKNYRNSRQILKAASRLANTYGQIAGKSGEEIDILDPELAVRETSAPAALKTNHQIKKAWEIAEQCLSVGQSQPWTICVATANPEKISVQDLLHLKPSQVSAEELTGDYIRERETMVVSTLNDVKGFEFNLMIVVGCDDGEFPAAGVPSEEIWRDALRLYVAMTRARDQVYLLYERAPSAFLESMRDEIRWEEEDLHCDYQPSWVENGKSVGLSADAKKRIDEILATATNRNPCFGWFSEPTIKVLRSFFDANISPVTTLIDYRGLTGRQAEAAERSLQADRDQKFESWLNPYNLGRLRAYQFHNLPNVKQRALRSLDSELRVKGLGSFLSKVYK
jgi:superfamily I DNA/RNA helicase